MKKVGTTPVAANILLSKYLDSPIVLKQDPSYQVLTKNYFYNHVIEKLHFISSGLVCFARGLNDTPKIAALLLIGSRFHIEFSIIAVGLFILIGGLIHSKSIAKTMGENITSMDGEQALTANLVAGFMVLFASRLGVPVSTTHVSCGAIFGIGASKKDLDFKTLKNILLAWVTTLPLGFLVGALIMYILTF